MSHLRFLRRRRLGRLGSPFSPQQMPGLLAHYDASTEPAETVPTVSNSPALVTMTDQAGKDSDGAGPRNFTQSNPGNQGIMVSGQSPSCLPYYVPDGAATFMTSPVGFSFTAGQSWTLFLAGNPGALFSPEPWLYGAGGAVGVDFNIGGLAFKDANGSHAIAPAVGGNQRQIWSFDGTNGQITVRRNGSQVGSIAWTPVAFAPAVLWRNGTAGTAFGVSRLGEWGVYNGVFDLTAIQALENYLKLKWFTVCPP